MGMKWETREDLLWQFPTGIFAETSALLQMFLRFDSIFLSGRETASWKLPPNTNTHIRIW